MNRKHLWELRIDTGGTFTDCIAIDPEGVQHRGKVLSSSALRGTAMEQTAPDKLRIGGDTEYPDHFFNGETFLWLQDPDHTRTVKSYSATDRTLTLDSPIGFPAAGQPGEPEKSSLKGSPVFEIRSNKEAPILAAHLVTGTPLDQPLPPLEMRLATTKGTNALLERKGANCALFITEGFGDLPVIGNQQRPDLFALEIHRPQPLANTIVEVPERIDAKGRTVKPLDRAAVKQLIKELDPSTESVAVCLMNSYINREHEEQLVQMLREQGFRYISSTGADSLVRIVPRAQTAVANACLSPVMGRYFDRVMEAIPERSLTIMNSAGSLTPAGRYEPKDGLLSGPAGGVTGAAAVGRRCGYNKLISFDMGGTSTDVARYDNGHDYLATHRVGDAELQAPAIAIETVAAGGGSVCGFDGETLTVGPESAGADPGPACYGAGGPLTVTDVNLLTSRLDPSNFHFPVDLQAAESAADLLLEKIRERKGEHVIRSSILEGFLDIANERMAQTILSISLEQGFDPAEYALVGFGGAGGQHAAAVAGKLGIDKVLIPGDAGLLSACGLDQSLIEKIGTRQILQPLEQVSESLSSLITELETTALENLASDGVSPDHSIIRQRSVFLRLKGQESSLELPVLSPELLESRFEELYRETYGHWVENRPVEVVMIRIIATEKAPAAIRSTLPDPLPSPEPVSRRKLLFGGGELEMPVFNRSDLIPGVRLEGPCLLLDPYSTLFIEPGWSGGVRSDGTVELSVGDERHTGEDHTEGTDDHAVERSNRKDDVINLQLYANRFTSIAEQMGELLRRTALSVNIRERLDFSCALLDAEGFLVVNAPHIPIHLGAMGLCVRTLVDTIEMNEGDIIITNHPGFGGSHLPDVTIVSPLFYEGRHMGFVASRAHHAEIGGKSPGSMPPDANSLEEEGVVIPPMHLIRKGEERWQDIRKLLLGSAWPTRSVEENMADLQAAVAANHRGAVEFKKLADHYGTRQVSGYMKKLKAYAEERMRLTLRKIEDGNYEAKEPLDDGSLLKVACTVSGQSLHVDFSGSAAVHSGNLNANPSIVNSVLIYILRLMVNEPLPLNEGLLEPVTITLPEGMLNPLFPDNPAECPAVVGGNIETSQRLADTLIKAFRLSACSQGTMNNVLFGNESFGYYETVAGGTGAGKSFHGMDAIHHHMTNTLATDPEILEHRYPVRLDRYAIRRGSGGTGRFRGGNGVIREITILEPIRLSVLCQHRIVPPFGMSGGGPGAVGRQWIERKDGGARELAWRDGAALEPGDRFILHTPGGGGFGKPE